ncbi:DUF429 domain-containing protein [uncultured Paludibaculum sp.]|uniref:DUF429 domain-containing protein n=1 Tax=uncultured Paludibaculum sp. TaxID=1765020 RepID=UPI002AAABC58|nr:DUF429 domain-containing protein [uncultured Paludibaculum sp.]
MSVFIGVDLGWYGKPTGLASVVLDGAGIRLRTVTRLESTGAILDWVRTEIGDQGGVVGVDAPTVIRNAAGIRPAERELNKDFRRFHAGCHAANLGLPFASRVLAFSHQLEEAGFRHGANMQAKANGRFQIEIHPHAASIRLFGLTRIVKYKRGRRAERAVELARLRGLMLSRLPEGDPPLTLTLPEIPEKGPTKPVEDQIDAVLCAYIAAHWWWWGTTRNTVYGSNEDGFIVVPGGERSP